MDKKRPFRIMIARECKAPLCVRSSRYERHVVVDDVSHGIFRVIGRLTHVDHHRTNTNAPRP